MRANSAATKLRTPDIDRYTPPKWVTLSPLRINIHLAEIEGMRAKLRLNVDKAVLHRKKPHGFVRCAFKKEEVDESSGYQT
jgi:hypothetical protein